MRLPVAAAITILAAGAALAQTAEPPRQGASRGGTVTNPPVAGSAVHPGAAAGSPDAQHPREPGIRHDSSVTQQAESRRREALELCQALTGASRADCVRRAEQDFKRATSDDTLSDRGPEPLR